MRPRRSTFTGVLLLATAAIPGLPCGPFFAEAIFVTQHTPENLTAFVGGNIGVVENSYWPRYVALAYRELSGEPFTVAEQTALIKANSSKDGDNRDQAKAEEVWTKARLDAGVRTKFQVQYDHATGQNQWETFQNCYFDAFRNAALTVGERRNAYPQAKAELLQYVEAQDKVFSNCDKQGEMPEPASVDSPDWLKKDRAYQIAAAHFYRMEWDESNDAFKAIAADRESPWSDLAQYLQARILIRKASFAEARGGQIKVDSLTEAEKLLRPIAEGHGRFAAYAKALLSYVLFRTDMQKASVEAANRLSHSDDNVAQDWIDLSFAMQKLDRAENPVRASEIDQDEAAMRKSDLIDWVLTMQNTLEGAGSYQHALSKWQATKSVPWLVAAMSLANTADSELLKAAESVPQSSPAYLTLAVHRLRLMDNPKRAYGEADRIISEFKDKAPRSAINHLMQIQRTNASTLHEFMRTAASVPAAYSYGIDGPDDWAPSSPEKEGSFKMAGQRVNGRDTPRFDLQTALVFNQALPLDTLIAAVLNGGLPKQLRFEMGQAVWTRAVLLNQPEKAAKLTSILSAGEPAWKPWLAAYDEAKTVDERKYAGLMAIMRYPSTSPSVNVGSGRDDGFAGYSYYRDNWWCGAGETSDNGWTFGAIKDRDFIGKNYDKDTKIVPLPAFVTRLQAERAEAEVREIDTPQAGSDAIAKEAIAWVKAHPRDKRNEDLLGFTFRMLRNGCSGSPWSQEPNKPEPPKEAYLEYQVFTLLHTKYPASKWSKKYRVWDKH